MPAYRFRRGGQRERRRLYVRRQPGRTSPVNGHDQGSSASRFQLMTGLSVLIILLLGLRLAKTAIADHQAFLALADGQQTGQSEVVATRGEIQLLDSPDKKATFTVAENRDAYAVSVIPVQVKDIHAVAVALHDTVGLEVATTEAAFARATSKWYLPPLQHDVAEGQKNSLEAKKLAGLTFVREPKRVYPEKNLAAQVIGFLNSERRGYGIEATYDNELTGQAGKQVGLVAKGGGFVSIAHAEPPQDGRSYELTIDRNIEFVVEDKLRQAIDKFQAVAGEAVVVEVKTGAIVAMAQEPSFDLNEFSKVPASQTQAYRNQSVSAPWEPGSIMKPLVIAGALDTGAVPKDFTGVYGSSVTIQSREIHTATNIAFGKETLSQILEHSDNVAMVDIANHLGNDRMRAELDKFGLGQKSGIDVTGEIAGDLPKNPWSDIRRATVSFGQGITVTPLQIVMAYAAIGNHGKLMKPYLVGATIGADGKRTAAVPQTVRQVVSDDASATVTQYLENVVLFGHGKKAAVAGYRVGGKTGTAQIPSADGGYDPNDHVGSFAGLVPISDPQYAIIVKLDRPKTVEFAESSAAPTFSEIAAFLLSYYRVAPDKIK